MAPDVRRMRAVVAVLLCASSSALGGSFGALLKRPRSFAQSASVALTASDCTGASKLLSDGTAIIWTRTTSATCTKADGSLATVTSGQTRCNTSNGCLFEGGPATNLALHSGDLTNATDWSFLHAGTGATGTITANTTDVVDPFGTNTAAKVTCPSMVGGEGASNQCFILNSFSMSGLVGSYSLSVWVRSDSGTKTFYLWGNGGASFTQVACTATATWSRCVNPGVSAPSAFRVGYDLRANQTGQGAVTLYFYGAQLETGTFATSYVPTVATAATRNADDVSFTKPAWLTSGAGCAAATLTLPSGFVSTGIPARLMGVGATNTLLHIGSSYNAVGITDGTNSAFFSKTLLGASSALRSYWQSSGISITDGTTINTASYVGGIFSTSTIELGSAQGSANALYGYLSNLKIGSSPGGCQ